MSPEELLFSDARKLLLRELKGLCGKGNLDEAFAAWLLPSTDVRFQLREAAQAVAEHTGGQRTYRDVAILGFAAAAGVLEDSQQEPLNIGLRWVSGREPLIDGQPMDFCTDAVGLLGIALGARSSDRPQDMIEQIAADSGLYLVDGSSYSHIVAFIWDDSRRSEQHDLLKTGLKQLQGIVDVVVISRPGSMVI